NILHLTSARLRRMFGDMTYPMPSRFIADLDDDVLCKSEKIQQPNMFSQAKAASSAQGIVVGAYVNHPSFGDGLIVDLEGDGDAVRVAIEFDAVGLKRLMLKYAALTVL
ncbi:MAG: DNA helicase II, partial [Ghiorsea sp.]|nr:DNA helicase II [Ghiorsea sp.]